MDRREQIRRALFNFKHNGEIDDLLEILDPQPVIKYRYGKADEWTLSYAHPGDSCFDLRTAQDIWLSANKVNVISTDLYLEIQDGFGMLIKPRSGLGRDLGAQILGGVIDGGYRGEIKVMILPMKNTQIRAGQRIAQALVHQTIQARFEKVETLTDSIRGENGFGSTGK